MLSLLDRLNRGVDGASCLGIRVILVSTERAERIAGRIAERSQRLRDSGPDRRRSVIERRDQVRDGGRTEFLK